MTCAVLRQVKANRHIIGEAASVTLAKMRAALALKHDETLICGRKLTYFTPKFSLYNYLKDD